MSDLNRPYIICHMMSTIDGKIASGIEGVEIFDDSFDLYTQTEDKLSVNGWLIGRVTMEMFAEGKETPLPSVAKTIDDTDFIVPHKEDFVLAAVDTKGILRWKDNIVGLSSGTKKTHLVIVVTNKTPKEYLAYLQNKNISYIFAGQDKIDFEIALQKLKSNFHIEKLALEGGGLINGSVMAAGLVDEISLLIIPLVLNRTNAPSVFERKGDTSLELKKYSLLEVKQLEDDTVWLRYKRKV